MSSFPLFSFSSSFFIYFFQPVLWRVCQERVISPPAHGGMLTLIPLARPFCTKNSNTRFAWAGKCLENMRTVRARVWFRQTHREVGGANGSPVRTWINWTTIHCITRCSTDSLNTTAQYTQCNITVLALRMQDAEFYSYFVPIFDRTLDRWTDGQTDT